VTTGSIPLTNQTLTSLRGYKDHVMAEKSTNKCSMSLSVRRMSPKGSLEAWCSTMQVQALPMACSVLISVSEATQWLMLDY
jgi:hypothetical protein